MTEIRLTANIKYPTKEINEESFEPLLKEFRTRCKEFMEEHLPNGKKIIMSRIKKKDKLKESYPANWVKKRCGICDKNFKTSHSRTYCGNCRLQMLKTRKSASDLYIMIHPDLINRLAELNEKIKLDSSTPLGTLTKSNRDALSDKIMTALAHLRGHLDQPTNRRPQTEESLSSRTINRSSSEQLRNIRDMLLEQRRTSGGSNPR